MSERVDHVARALRALQSSEGSREDAFAAVAQAEATLALLEQVRIANLIALNGDSPDHRVGDALHEFEGVRDPGRSGIRYTSLRPEVAAALGIGEANHE